MSGPGDPRTIACPHGRGFNCPTCWPGNTGRPLQPAPRHDFAAMKAALKGGVAVQAVSAPHLFPTPPAVAARMVELLDLDSWNGEAWQTLRVLEPSAGTGALIDALYAEAPDADLVAWEINYQLAKRLRDTYKDARVMDGDFLTAANCGPLDLFDAVLMNPPFNGFDWKHHLRHAWRQLKPGGRMVALLPQAPRVRDVVRELDSGAEFEPLPDGTFAGTGARTLLAVLNKPDPV